MRTALRHAATVLAVAALAACTSGEPAETPTPDAAESPSPSEAAASADVAEPVVVEGEIDGAPARVEVGPVVVEGDLAVLRMAVEATGDEEVATARLGFTYNDLGRPAPDDLRLVDATALTVSPVAQDVDGNQAVEDAVRVQPGAPAAVFHAVVAAPTGDTTAVLVPYLGYVDDVPVAEAGSTAAAAVTVTVADVADAIGDTPADLIASTVPLDSYRVVEEGAVTARRTAELVTVALASDVLFAFDSAELSPDADGALAVAAEELTGVDGDLLVVGHTDDQGEDAYNVELSRARAQAVVDRLGATVDLGGLDVQVEGRGSAEPRVPGQSDGARAANRRVELLFTPAEQPTPVVQDQDPGAATPPADGPVGTAGDGVVVERPNGKGSVRVRVEEVVAVDRLMVGTVVVESVDGEPGSPGFAVSGVLQDTRGELSSVLQFAATGVTLLHGQERVYPLDYVHPGSDARRPLAELSVSGEVPVGGSRRVTVVWPRLPGDTVDVDLARTDWGGITQVGAAWRLADVPVVEVG